MGKLKEAALRRHAALQEHLQKPMPDFNTDPAGAYQYVRKGRELEFQIKQYGRLIAAAFRKLPEQTQTRFYEQTLSQARKRELVGEEFQRRWTAAKAAGQLQDFLREEWTNGLSPEELLAFLKAGVNPDKLLAKKELENPELSVEEQTRIVLELISPLEAVEAFRLAVDGKPENQQALFAAACRKTVEDPSFLDRFVDHDTFGEGEAVGVNLGRFEELLPEQEREALAEQIDRLPPPEKLPNRTVCPVEQELKTLTDGIQAGDPRAAEKRALLREAGEILTYPTSEYLYWLDAVDGGGSAPLPSAQKLVDSNASYNLHKFLGEKHPGNRLAERLPHSDAIQFKGKLYLPGDVRPLWKRPGMPDEGVELREEELEDLRNVQAPLPKEVKDAVLEIGKAIEQIGVDRFIRPGVAEKYVDGKGKTHYLFAAEQGNKKYAFWPIVDTKTALEQAVREGNWAEIGRQVSEYRRIKPLYDSMMRSANAVSTLPLFPGNINSTRPRNEQPLNPVPAEYLEDFPGHSRVNGAFYLYAVSKTWDIPMERLLDDPGGVCRELSRRVADQNHLGAHRNKPVGTQLMLALNLDHSCAACDKWRSLPTMLSRALDTPIAMIPDADERILQSGRVYGALSAANYEFEKQMQPWRAISEGSEAARTAVTQMAMLLPPDQLDFEKLGRTLMKPGWEKTMNPAAVADQLRKSNALDLGAIVSRTKQVMDEAKTAQEQDPSLRSKMDLNWVALQNYRTVMRMIPAAERKTEGWKQMAAHAAELQFEVLKQTRELDPELWEENRQTLCEAIEGLEKKKSGFLLSTTDTPEHQRMAKAMRRFLAKLDLAAGRQIDYLTEEELARVRAADLGQLALEARQAGLQYCRLKTNGGTSGFVHEAGSDRYRHAVNATSIVGQLSDNFGNRSPALAEREKMALDTLWHRRSSSWIKENVENYAAKTIYALSLQFKGINYERQRELLEPDKVDAAVEQIKQEPFFRRLVRSEGLKGLADKLISGPDALTEAVMNKQNQAEQGRNAPARRTVLDRAEFWKNGPSYGD